MKKVINNFISLITVTIAIFLIVVTAQKIFGGIPNIFGYRIMYITSASMEPELKVGDVIIVKNCLPEELKAGDIITYKGEKNDFNGKLITHRVTEIQNDEGGALYIVTRGDANSTPDPRIRFDQVLGRMVANACILSGLYSFFFTPYGFIIFVFLILLMFANDFGKTIKRIREKKDPPPGNILMEETEEYKAAVKAYIAQEAEKLKKNENIPMEAGSDGVKAETEKEKGAQE